MVFSYLYANVGHNVVYQLVWQWQSKVVQYMCITTNQPDAKSNRNPNSNPKPTTKQHAIVNIQLYIVACAKYPEKFIREYVVAPFVLLSMVNVTQPSLFVCP